MQTQPWLRESKKIREPPAGTHTFTNSLCVSQLPPTLLTHIQFIWQGPCGLDAEYGVRLFYSEQAVTSQQTCYWSLHINWVLLQLAAMLLTNHCMIAGLMITATNMNTHTHLASKQVHNIVKNINNIQFSIKAIENTVHKYIHLLCKSYFARVLFIYLFNVYLYSLYSLS